MARRFSFCRDLYPCFCGSFLSQPGSSEQACELIAEVARFALTLD
jgi:hypothetical protein